MDDFLFSTNGLFLDTFFYTFYQLFLIISYTSYNSMSYPKSTKYNNEHVIQILYFTPSVHFS